jgi:DNA polymerase alpha subunit A
MHPRYVLERILSDQMTEVVVEEIHEYLGTIGANVRACPVRLEDFVINKRLRKNLEDYPDAKSQPHVQVALRAGARGGTAKAGDVVSYVLCVPEGADEKGAPPAKAAQADCAKSPDEVRRSDGALKIGESAREWMQIRQR